MANIQIKNIYYMLSYAFQNLRETGFDNIATEEFDSIHDLFAAILARGIGLQIKQGLHREYIQIEEEIVGLRGQVMVSETIKRQTLSRGRLFCSYDEFSTDSPYNQILKSVVFLLLRHGDVRPKNKRELHKLLLYFADVKEIAPTSIRWDIPKYQRNNASYRMLLELCRMVMKGLLLTTDSGKQKLSTWLQDEAMHRLYEKFVLSYYLRHHPEYSPKASFISWDIDDGTWSKYLPLMKSDITLQNGEKSLIIDTKYYGRTMQYNPLYDSKKFISANIYQIYSYVKNRDKAASGNVAGILLYAKTDEFVTPNEDMMIGGNRISLKTLDLNQNWSVIIEQLENLCIWLRVS